jgi:hypothetical protein
MVVEGGEENEETSLRRKGGAVAQIGGISTHRCLSLLPISNPCLVSFQINLGSLYNSRFMVRCSISILLIHNISMIVIIISDLGRPIRGLDQKITSRSRKLGVIRVLGLRNNSRELRRR